MGKHDYTIHVGTWEKSENGVAVTLKRTQEGMKDVEVVARFSNEEALAPGLVAPQLRQKQLEAIRELLEVIPIEEDAIS